MELLESFKTNKMTEIAQNKSPGIAIRSPEDLLRGWLREKASTTHVRYQQVLERFAVWRGEPLGTALTDLFSRGSGHANAVVLEYREHLQERQYSPAYINVALSALRSYAKYARMGGLWAGTLEVPNVPAQAYRDTRGVGFAGFSAILDAVEDWASHPKERTRNKAIRDRAILLLLYNVALRCSEVVKLHTRDVLVGSKELRIHPKGGEKNPVPWPVGERAWEAILAWLHVRGDIPGALFVRANGTSLRPLSPRGLYAIVAARGSEAGLKCTPHGLRHSAITEALDRTGGDVRRVAAFSRHKKVETLMVYDDRRGERPREIIELLEAEKK